MGTSLHFMHQTTLVTKRSHLWCFPGLNSPGNRVVSLDENGDDLSLFEHDSWDFSAFGSRPFNFGNYKLTDQNLVLAKQTVLLVLYHPSLFPGSIKSCKVYFTLICKIAKVCDKYGVLLSELSRFPKIHGDIAKAIQCSHNAEYINKLHKLLLYKDDLGFVIADKKTIEYLVSNLKARPEIVQHPYIPPRIWDYQLRRLNECLDDYLKFQTEIEKAFDWCSRAYEYNLSAGISKKLISPFSEPKKLTSQRITYEGGFEKFSQENQVFDLLQRWRKKNKRLHIQEFTTYLTLVAQVSLFYILNFSLQRLGEVAGLKSNCYETESDEKLGEVSLIVGETTKTDPDADARWVVPKSVKKAIDVATSISRMRIRFKPGCDLDNDDPVDLLMPAWEPWCSSRKSTRKPKRQYMDYKAIIRTFPGLFDLKEITVTEEDWKIALALTPNLAEKEGFGVGLPWQFSAHQLRRTTCVNMFASNLVSDNTLQWSMKHLSRNMTLYYGRNYTNLRMNSEVETALILESYRAIYRQLGSIVEDTVEYVRPNKIEVLSKNTIDLVDEQEEKQLLSLIKKGLVGSRQTLLGFCMKTSSCEYGGIESVAKCAGMNRESVCADAIFVRKNKDKLIELRKGYKRELKTVEKDTPRYSALKQEIYAIGVYLNVIEQ